LDALCDDLNTPQAMAELNALLKEENSPALKARLIAAGKLLGILQQNPQEWLGYHTGSAILQGTATVTAHGEKINIDALLEERTQAKADKNFARADEIRDELAAKGIEIIDTPEGSKWRKVS